jgi:glucose/arabinose dehydrogenase
VFGPDKNLYIAGVINGPGANSGESAIFRYDGQTGELLNAVALAGEFYVTEGLVFGPDDGHLYVNTKNNVTATNSVKIYDGQTGMFLGELVPPGATTGLEGQSGLVFGPDGFLYVSSGSTNRVLRYDVQRRVFLDIFVPSEGRALEEPAGLVFGPDGHLYVSNYGNSEVLRFDGQTGAFLNAFVPSGSGGLRWPEGLMFGPDKNLYVSNSDAFDVTIGEILRYDGQTGTPLPVGGASGAVFVSNGSGGLQRPAGLVFGPDNNLYVSSTGSDAILRYDRQTGAFLNDFVPPGSGGLQGPSGLVFGPDGHLYVNSGSSAILRYDGRTGTPLPVSGASGAVFVPPGSGGLSTVPYRTRFLGLVFGPDGHLYVSNLVGGQILRFDGQTGAFLNVFVGSGILGGLGVGGVTGPSGLLFFTPSSAPTGFNVSP